MNGETANGKASDEIEGEPEDQRKDTPVSQDEPEETIVIETDDDDNVGDISVEINVDELIAKIETDDSDEAVKKREAHRKLEELNERRKVEEDLDSTYNFNLDDDP